MLYRRLKFALIRLLRREEAERELEEEIRSHLEIATRERLYRGEAPDEAEQNARREFGNEVLVREITRETWGAAALVRLAGDMRRILRDLGRRPVFTVTAVLTLALGLGGTTAMFSIVNGVLLEPLQFREPERLYLARTLPPANSKISGEFPVNARHFHEWRSRCRSCEEVALVRYDTITLVGAGEPVQLPTYTVSFNFFRALGVQPSLGRDFLPDEELPGHFGEVILTDALWRSRFAGDPSIAGRAIGINGESYTVAGVMPAGLHLPKGDEWGPLFGPQTAPLIFRPLGIDAARARPVGNMNYTAVVRLKPGVRREQAMAEMNALLAEFVQAYKIETTTTLIPLGRQVIRRARAPLWMLLGAVGAVLLIACVNVGNLMLVRISARQREAGVRMALGASRGQLFGLVLKEALVLVTAGGAIGLALSGAGLKWFVASAPVSLPRIEEVQIDWRVLAFAAFATAVSTIVCGLFPAWRLSRVEPLESIKGGAAGSTESRGGLRLREALVGVEVALSTVLLIVGGLLISSFLRLMSVDKGFEVAHLITQDISFLSPKYREDARCRFLDEILRKLAQVPGVESAAAVNQLPLIGEDWLSDLEDPQQPRRPAGNAALANFRFTTPDYWKTMGIPLKQGRFLDESDRNRPRALISERVAQYLWPNQNPIGKHVLGAGRLGPSLEVVGVAGEVRAAGLEQSDPTMMVYEDYWRMKPIGMSIVARTYASPAPVSAALRAIVTRADPEMAISSTRTMEQILDESVSPRKFETDLAAAFAAAALALASIGIYGVISFTVVRRTPEIGIRIALGARGFPIVAMVMRRGMLPVLAGIAAGLVGALSGGRLLASQLYGISPYDAGVIVTVSITLLGAALCACWIPAMRATRIDPTRALRFE